ncbi:MAG TPA: DegT/DnrJ/EryC1/StrS family aminotransferase, partial [Candidatus Ozemobacteraceae bacterium]|nr:DegT/DnrJ/EryC1/StrS family aminotransferase [Candidatus Ozemobacteraceae bacterium]
MIEFLSCRKINDRFREEFTELFQRFLDRGQYILGEQVVLFEEAFAAFCGTRHCVGVGNGLDALELILHAYQELGRLSRGDEILVPANTYIATILSIVR